MGWPCRVGRGERTHKPGQEQAGPQHRPRQWPALQGCGVPASSPWASAPLSSRAQATGHRMPSDPPRLSPRQGSLMSGDCSAHLSLCLQTQALLSLQPNALRRKETEAQRAHLTSHTGAVGRTAMGSRRLVPRDKDFSAQMSLPRNQLPKAALPWRQPLGGTDNTPLGRNQQRGRNSHRTLGPKEGAGRGSQPSHAPVWHLQPGHSESGSPPGVLTTTLQKQRFYLQKSQQARPWTRISETQPPSLPTHLPTRIRPWHHQKPQKGGEGTRKLCSSPAPPPTRCVTLSRSAAV